MSFNKLPAQNRGASGWRSASPSQSLISSLCVNPLALTEQLGGWGENPSQLPLHLRGLRASQVSSPMQAFRSRELGGERWAEAVSAS